MSNSAWVTLTTNDTYSLGALVLAHSLKRVGTQHQLVVLVTPGVSETMREKLRDVYNVVKDVNVMDSQDAANLALLARPELGITFTKLHCWCLTQFEKCVFLDSDTLVLQNCDELFEREELSAAPDVSWPDCFNSGVFVFKPSLETFNKITEFALKNGSFDGGDQGLLNSYFSDWAHMDIQKHLPFIYNVAAYASYCYLPAFKQFKSQIKILHFAGKMKPWLIQFNSQNKTACTPSDYAHASDLIQLWWDIFCDNVHHKLTCDMNRRNYENLCVTQQQQQQQSEQQRQKHTDEKIVHKENSFVRNQDYHFEFYDPWQDYYENMEKQAREREEKEKRDLQQMESETTENVFPYETTKDRLDNEEEEEKGNQEYHVVHEEHKAEEQSEVESRTDKCQDFIGHERVNEIESDNASLSCEKVTVEAILIEPLESSETSDREFLTKDEFPNEAKELPSDYSSTMKSLQEEEQRQHEQEEQKTNDEANRSTNEDRNVLTEALVIEVDNIQTPDIETQSVANNTEKEAGLAGALSQLRLGEPKTPEQEAYEQLMRRQCWESGQIDYTGRDSFDNIWKKIMQTLEEKPSTKNEQEKSGSL